MGYRECDQYHESMARGCEASGWGCGLEHEGRGTGLLRLIVVCYVVIQCSDGTIL